MEQIQSSAIMYAPKLYALFTEEYARNIAAAGGPPSDRELEASKASAAERPPDPAPAAASAGLAEGVTELTAALFGSSLLPSEVWNGCAFLQLGAVVRCAFSASGLTVAEWNALPPLDREARLAHAVYWMRGLVPTCAAAPDKASDRAASAGKSGSPGQENGAPAKAWLVRLTCCGRDNGKYETATRAEADAFRNDYLNAPGHVRSAIIEAAAPLPEKQSESRAASAGEGALRDDAGRLDCLSHDRLEAMLRASETAREADRHALNDARCRIAELERNAAAVDAAYLARLSERNEAIAENQRLQRASSASAPEGPSKAVESGAALAPAQRERK